MFALWAPSAIKRYIMEFENFLSSSVFLCCSQGASSLTSVEI